MPVHTKNYLFSNKYLESWFRSHPTITMDTASFQYTQWWCNFYIRRLIAAFVILFWKYFCERKIIMIIRDFHPVLFGWNQNQTCSWVTAGFPNSRELNLSRLSSLNPKSVDPKMLSLSKTDLKLSYGKNMEQINYIIEIFRKISFTFLLKLLRWYVSVHPPVCQLRYRLKCSVFSLILLQSASWLMSNSCHLCSKYQCKSRQIGVNKKFFLYILILL